MPELKGSKIIPKLIKVNWVHNSSFIWIEAQKQVIEMLKLKGCFHKHSVGDSVRAFQDFMNWEEDDAPTEALKLRYYRTRNTFFEDRDKIKQD